MKTEHWQRRTTARLSVNDGPIVIVGNGPSATKDAVDEIPLHVDVFGVNRIERVSRRCDAILFADMPVWLDECERWRDHGRALGLIVYDELFGCKTIPTELDRAHEVYAFSLQPANKPQTWPVNPGDPLARYGTTTSMAAQLAIVHGAREIYFLGCDHTAEANRANGEPTHNYDGPVSQRASGGGSRTKAEAFYTAFQEHAETRGVKVFNLSPDPRSVLFSAGYQRADIRDLR